jgi:hypothetical protein
MDQFGCSSPNSVFWLGKNNIAKKNFWFELSKIVNKKYDLDLSGANKKISNLMNYTLDKNKRFKANIKNFNLITLKSKKLSFDNFENINFGTFLEINLHDINHLRKYTSEKLQTLPTMGLTLKV